MKRLVSSLAIIVLGAACAQSTGEDPNKKKSAKADKKEAKKDAKKDAKKADKKEAKKDAKKADKKEAKAARKFRKGQHAPKGLTPDELKAYAEAQGDPKKGEFSLADALAGDDKLADAKNGKLTAVFDTTMGKFECELYEDKAPKTVANFVGLARGVRPSYDKESDKWVDKKFYDGIVFHRVIKGFMIQTGDPTGSGTGGPGYVIEDEFGEGLKHKNKGLLSMANRGKNTGSSQFFVTVAPTPHLDNKHAIFGKCDPKVPVAISEVKVDPRRNHRPYEPVSIKTVEIKRKK